MNEPIAIEKCFKMLQKQILLVNDVHASIIFKNDYFNKEDIDNNDVINSFRASEIFKNHPTTKRNLSVLKTELEQKHANDIEGIYNYGTYQKIGVYFSDNKKDLIGVVLESELKHWEIGQIKFYATHINKNQYNILNYDAFTRKPMMVKSLTLENGRLWRFKKAKNTFNAELPIQGNSDWEFKQLKNDIQYIYFGNFSSFSTKNRKAFKTFYDSMKKKLTAKNIIVDLRSNGGGNSKLSDPFLKLLKKKNIFIITNAFTSSNAEQFTLKLKKIDNAKHLGQTTRGVIAYGMNYGYRYNTPSNYFTILPTDMDFHKYITYEGAGISPDISLDFDKDWIEQTLAIIEYSQL
jgi:hypothetical protein